MKKNILLLFILFIAALLRFYHVSSIPPSLTWDEVSWGYNAYSLGIDGKDEFGRFLPYDYLESFGDFKPPVYAYLTVIPVLIFGLTEFAVRFASAFFGTLTVLVTYFLVKRIFPDTKSKLEIGSHLPAGRNLKLDIPIIASALLAISPWHIMLSRAAFEANIGTFFLVTGIWLFLEAIHRRPYLLIFSAVSFILTIYTFNSDRIVAPLLVLILAIGFRKKLLKMKKIVVIASIVGLLLTLPTAQFLLSPQARLRFQEVNIFSDIDIIKMSNQQIANDNNAWWSKIIHNRRIAYGNEFLRHYFDNFSFEFLFIKGDTNPKFSTRALGQMYLWELPFLIAGILFLFKKREGHWWLVPLWLLIGIIPAATARETPHALRIETTLPTFQILVAYGLTQVFLLTKKKIAGFPLRLFLFMGIGIVALCNFIYFIDVYSTHYPKEFSSEWQYGYKEAIAYVDKVENKYNKIYMTGSLGRPYIYFLFYKKYDPVKFRENAQVHRDSFGFVNVESFDKYYFDKARDKLSKDKNVLYIDTPADVDSHANIKKKFYYVNGMVALVAYTRD